MKTRQVGAGERNTALRLDAFLDPRIAKYVVSAS